MKISKNSPPVTSTTWSNLLNSQPLASQNNISNASSNQTINKNPFINNNNSGKNVFANSSNIFNRPQSTQSITF
jgi:hypothetical protein